jgi:hypothetical protein
MATEERAEALYASLDFGCGCCKVETEAEDRAKIAAALRAAVAEEREGVLTFLRFYRKHGMHSAAVLAVLEKVQEYVRDRK